MTDQSADLSIEALRRSGANRFDPARFRYIESLHTRAGSHNERVRAILHNKADCALQAYQADYASARERATALAAEIAADFPERAERVKDLLQRSEFSALKCLAIDLRDHPEPGPVAALVTLMDQDQPDAEAPAGELASTRRFRDTLARRNADKLLARAIQDAPENPGPLNPEMLAIRSLSVMAELSPQYLGRFVTYIDTLLWLEQAGGRTSSQKP